VNETLLGWKREKKHVALSMRVVGEKMKGRRQRTNCFKIPCAVLSRLLNK
jgi:hypothetical protein